MIEKAKRGAVAVSLAATLFLEPFGTGDAEARERLVRAPLAQTPELQDTQRVMIEAWNLIRTTYVDPSFNHVDWDNELAVRLRSVATSESVEEGQRQLKDLVSDLGDVYTRWMPANTYQEFLTDSINSEVQGVGLLIASDPVSGKHLVLSPIQGGPAALAGIQSGDEIVRVNGGRAGEFRRRGQGAAGQARHERRAGDCPPGPGGGRHERQAHGGCAIGEEEV